MKIYHNDMQIVRDRQRQLMTAANHHRLLQIVHMYRPSLGGRVLAGLGGWMIANGTRLKTRYTEASQDVQSYQSSVQTSTDRNVFKMG